MNGASNNVGFLFSTKQFNLSNYAPTNNFCHFKVDSIVKDTIGWELVSGSFIADSAYAYLTLGNFYKDTSTLVIKYYITTLNPLVLTCYTFIDDIYVGYDSTQDVGINNIGNIEVKTYPNPTSRKIIIHTDNVKVYQISLFNEVGINIVTENISPTKSEIEMDVSKYANGIYFLKIKTDKGMTSSRFTIFHQQ
jgi:hypothetical protein